jgi:predicted amino acid-binding ACT domain protein
VTVWFTVKLDDRPGSLARVATALAERGVNITGIVGVAEDTDGALMLTTSDPVATRDAFASLELAFDDHDPTGGIEPEGLSIADLRPGAAGRGSLA